MKVLILGAGGHGQVVADMIAAGARAGDEVLELAGFLDDDPTLLGTEVDGAPVLGFPSAPCDAFARGNGSRL